MSVPFREVLMRTLRGRTAEITRLRNELHIAQEWSARVIAGHEQDIAEITALRAENERMRAALRNCIGLLDGLVAESGRSIEWGEEDPFRMGEWFEVEDLEQIKEARAALAAPSGALEEKQ